MCEIIIKKTDKVLVQLGQRSCLNKIKEATALLPLCCVVPLTGILITVGDHALPKSKIAYGIINFFVV